MAEEKEKDDSKKEAIKSKEDLIKNYEDKLKKIEDELESAKEKVGEEAAKAAKELEHAEHELHHGEHELQHDMDKMFKEEGSPYMRIKEISKEIKELKAKSGEKNESTLLGFSEFLNESEAIDEEYEAALQKSYLRDHSTLRAGKANLEIDEFIKSKLGHDIDEEFTQYCQAVQYGNNKKD